MICSIYIMSLEVILSNILHVTETCLDKLTPPTPHTHRHTHTSPVQSQSTQILERPTTSHCPHASDVDLPHVVLRCYALDNPFHPTFDPVHPQLLSLQLQLQVDTVLDNLIPTFKIFPFRKRRCHRGYGVVLPPRHALLYSFGAQIEQLNQTETEGDKRCHQHEPDEDRFLCRPGEEAVHLVWAGEAGAHIAGLKGETVKKVLTHDEQNFQEYLGHKMEDITAKEAATDADLATTLGVFGNLVGLTKEQTCFVIQLCLFLHPLLHLELEEHEIKFNPMSCTEKHGNNLG